jgi:hypothetical protein
MGPKHKVKPRAISHARSYRGKRMEQDEVQGYQSYRQREKKKER